MNGPPPLAVSDLRKSNKKTGEKTQDQKDLTSTILSRDDIAEIVKPDPEEKTQDQTDLISTTLSRDDIEDIVKPDPEEKISNDAGGNMFNRFFSSLKRKGNNGSKIEKLDIQDSQLNKPVEEVLEQIETDIEEGNLAAVDVDEKTAKSGRNILKEVFPPKNSIANPQQVPRRYSTIRSADLDVVRIVNAEYVKPNNRRPVNINNKFPSTNHRVYCFTVVQNLGRPVNISHFWYRDGKFMARVPMEVGFSSSWRCWSYITLKDGFEGDWKVVVRGPTNQEIEEINFSIFPDKNLAKKKQ